MTANKVNYFVLSTALYSLNNFKIKILFFDGRQSSKLRQKRNLLFIQKSLFSEAHKLAVLITACFILRNTPHLGMHLYIWKSNFK